jgi:hypothetical protein
LVVDVRLFIFAFLLLVFDRIGDYEGGPPYAMSPELVQGLLGADMEPVEMAMVQ